MEITTAKLLKDVLSKLGSKYSQNTTAGKVPAPIERRVKSISGLYSGPLFAADHDILVMCALAELIDEERIRPLRNKDENQLQLDFGVNWTPWAGNSPAQSRAVLLKMQDTRQVLEALKAQCEIMPTLAQTIIAKSLMLRNTISEMQCNRAAQLKLINQCQRNKQAIENILQRLNNIILMSEQIVRADGGR